MKTFEDWNYEELELAFGLKRVDNFPPLTNWLAAKHVPTQTENDVLTMLQGKLKKRVDSWNEDETKFFFIGPLVTLVDFIGDDYGAFTQRNLSFKAKDTKGKDTDLKGRVEFMVALGKVTPRSPYFFLHEYKQEKKRDRDPLGQVLSAMLCTQKLNKTEGPIYGCFVTGRTWFFVLLQGSEYGLSLAFDATQSDIFDIFSILKGARFWIEAQVKIALAAGL